VFARQHPDAFGQCFQDSDWFSALWTHALEKESRSRALVLDQLFSLKQPVFWFFPSPDNLVSGWRDFWHFAWAYQRMPTEDRDKFGPYFFTLQQAQLGAKK
jgi:hypothetical protein